jgi:hypothetical protein
MRKLVEWTFVSLDIELLEATPFASGIVVLKYAPGARR